MRVKILLFAVLACIGAVSAHISGKMKLPSETKSAPAADAASNVPAQEPHLSGMERDPKFSKLIAKLKKSADKFQGTMGIYFKDIKTGEEWILRGDDLYPSASLIKIPMAIALYRMKDRGELDFNTKLTMTRELRTGGSGVLKRKKRGSKFTIKYLTDVMISESDNTAANMIIDHVGYEKFQKEFIAMGLKTTNICEEGMSLLNYGVKRENLTTPAEMGQILDGLYYNKYTDRQSSQAILSAMKKSTNRFRFAKRLPRNIKLAHKTGMLRLSCHDMGIFYSPTGNYILAVLTWHVPDYRYASNYISKVAQLTYKHYGNGRA